MADSRFHDAMAQGYGFTEPTIVLGGPMLGADVLTDVKVQAPLSMMNRHGLVAGATGTGKTKTLQIIAGELSDAGVPSFIADVKGDVTGIAQPGDPTNPKVQERATQLGWTYKPEGHPVEFLSLSGKLGAQVRATVHSFGAVLLGKVMDLNETQTSVLSLIFKYCDDNQLPLLDLADLRTTLQFLTSDDGKATLADYGGMSTQTVGVLLRAIVNLEEAGADVFFGEPEFDVNDLIRATPDGKGVVSVIELSDVMDKPRLRAYADRGYFNGPQIKGCADAGIVPFVPKPMTSNAKADGRFDKRDFIYIAKDDEYQCPAGQRAIYRFTREENGLQIRRYWSSACPQCPMKAQCTPSDNRRISRWEHESVLEAMQRRLNLQPEAMTLRRCTVEHVFGTLKHWMGSTHFLTRRLVNVGTEMSLQVLAYNLKRVINILGIARTMKAVSSMGA